MTSVPHRHAPGYRAIRWNMDWITRPLFGLVLAALAVAALVEGPAYFSLLVALITAGAAREWHRMVGPGRASAIETAITALTVGLAEAAVLATGLIWPGLLVVAVGAGALFLRGRARELVSAWEAAAPLYLGLPAVALTALRAFEPQSLFIRDLDMSAPRGALVIVGMFLIVWATDSGALIFGNLIGGPRLAPRLSPSKTWAGTIGGCLTAALVFSLFILFVGGKAWMAALFGVFFSITSHAGDLFESFVKRRFGIKNSGSLIPGHGGVLDRMDSTVITAIVLALMVFLAHFDPLFGRA